jgi:hypothetical protein
MRLLFAFVAILVGTVAASAQGYTINTPGQMPTFVNPNGNGGYIVNQPGQMPKFINATGNGNYVVNTPGQMPTFINRTGPVAPCFGLNCR